MQEVFVIQFKNLTSCLLSCGCEKYFRTLKEEHKLQIFGKKIRKIFGPTSNEVQVS
jgi:hypothetical protein